MKVEEHYKFMKDVLKIVEEMDFTADTDLEREAIKLKLKDKIRNLWIKEEEE